MANFIGDYLITGLGCMTVMNADGAAIAAANILALNDHRVWAKLRAKQLNTWIGLKGDDEKIRGDS